MLELEEVDFGSSKVKSFAKHAKRVVSFRIKKTKHVKLAVSRKAKFRETAD
jgi:hypothetical protein